MKKFTKVFVVMCLLLALVLSLAACATSGTLGKDEQGRFKLAAPKITLNNDIVSWESVRYGKTYGITIGENEEKTTTQTQYPLHEVSAGATVKIKVRAIGDNVETVSSPYSNELTYSAPNRLACPTNLTIDTSGDNVTISWDAVQGASSYVISQTFTLKAGNQIRTSNTNSLVIAKSEFEDPDIYYFRVRAISGDKQTLWDSNDSVEMVNFRRTEKLKDPVPAFKNQSITWDEVTSADNYRIYLEKTAGDKFNSEKVLVDTLSKNTKSYGYDKVKTAIDKYKEVYESKNSGTTISTTGEYKIFVQAIHASHPEIYLDSEMAEVQKVVTEGEGDNAVETKENITFKKPAPVSEIKINKETITVDEKPMDVEMLRWNGVGDYKQYNIVFYSNGANILDTTHKIEDSENQTKYNLTSKFNESSYSQHMGKVMEITIAVAQDFSNGLIASDAVYLKDDSTDKNIEYCPVTKELQKVGGDGEFADYYKISNLGDLQKMMQMETTANNKFRLTQSIDGGRSSTNCNFYAGTKDFKGIFDGGNFIISNINLIVNNTGSSISLFNQIATGAQFKNVVFSNVTIKTDDINITKVALIADVNNGVIEGVNMVSSTFETKCQTAGIVITNNGEVNACGVLGTKFDVNGIKTTEDTTAQLIGVQSYVAGIAINNSGTIFNVSIYNSNFITETRLANIKAGGITVVNSGDIKNSFVRNSLISAKTFANNANQVSAVSGGLTAENSGNITECYVSHRGSNSKAVEANTNTTETSIRNSVAGGLVGIMNGGSIKSCYVLKARIVAEQSASGMVGVKDGVAVTISDSYVFLIDLAGARNRSMILTETTGVTANKVFCVSLDSNANTNNATVVGRSELISKASEMEGFIASKSDYSEEPILKNMIYIENEKYEVEYSKTANRTLIAYVVTDERKVVCNPDDAWKCDLTTSGKKVDIYTTSGSGIKLVIPVLVTVK